MESNKSIISINFVTLAADEVIGAENLGLKRAGLGSFGSDRFLVTTNLTERPTGWPSCCRLQINQKARAAK